MNTSQYYLSCEHLEYNVVFFTDRIRVCCGDEIRRSNSLLPGIAIDDIILTIWMICYQNFVSIRSKL